MIDLTGSAANSVFRHPNRILASLALAFAACSASANAHSASVPTHCRAGEFAHLNANMSEVRTLPKPAASIYELRKTGKLLSICADRSSQPLRSLSYRFGPPGKVEMEQVATPSRRFRMFDRSTSPHTGEEVLFFTVGAYTYCVRAATGQGQGIGLMVLKEGRTILDLFSGTEVGKDFEGGLDELVDIAFSANASPLQGLKTDAPFRTSCDAKQK